MQDARDSRVNPAILPGLGLNQRLTAIAEPWSAMTCYGAILFPRPKMASETEFFEQGGGL
jgi:hypothetical protein